MAKIIIVGDLFPVKTNLSFFSEGNVGALFDEKICRLFSDADFRICNMEGALTDGEQRAIKTGPVITAPTIAVNGYKALGIDLCMLSNNHITDAGSQGVFDTMESLEKAGIQYIGAGGSETTIKHYVIQNYDGIVVCIYNVSETMYNKPSSNTAGVWLYDEYVVCKELELLKNKCDYIVVIYHGGIEKFRYPSPEIKKRFHRMAESGANVILSQHTHCIGCEEYYNGSYLLYGQGDFLFNNFRPHLTDTGLIVEISFDKNDFKVVKYKTKTLDFKVRYDEEQDFHEFEERSALILQDGFIEEKFQVFCQKELRLYLSAFKSLSFRQRVMRKLFPSCFRKWLYYKSYRKKDLMFVLHTLRSEQNRETAIVGIEKLVSEI